MCSRIVSTGRRPVETPIFAGGNDPHLGVLAIRDIHLAASQGHILSILDAEFGKTERCPFVICRTELAVRPQVHVKDLVAAILRYDPMTITWVDGNAGWFICEGRGAVCIHE